MISIEDTNPDWMDEQDSWDGSVVRDDEGLSGWQDEVEHPSIILNTPLQWSIRDCGLAARRGRDTPAGRLEWSAYYQGLYRIRGPDPGVYNTLLRRHGIWSLPNPVSPGNPDHHQWCSDGIFLADVDFLLGAWMDRLHLGSRRSHSTSKPSSSLMSSRAAKSLTKDYIDRPDFQHAETIGAPLVEVPTVQSSSKVVPSSSGPSSSSASPPSSPAEEERSRRRLAQKMLNEEDQLWEAETLRMRRRWDALQHGWDLLFRGSSLYSPGSEVDVLERAFRDADRRRRAEWMKSAAFCQALLFMAPEENWLWIADVLHNDNRIILCRLIAKQASLSDLSRSNLVERWKKAGWIDHITASKIYSSSQRRDL
jgi:hypothetical protein